LITKISVDGFKSLSDFSLVLRPGLNILVGPNGSGKTNIVSFFEFLAQLLEVEASEATSRVGGAGAVFRRIGEEYQKEIHAAVHGCVPVPEAGGIRRSAPLPDEAKFILYEYHFSLVFPEPRDSVLFVGQRLCMRYSDSFLEGDDRSAGSWQVDIQSKRGTDGNTTVLMPNADESVMELGFGNPSLSPDERMEQTRTLIAYMLSRNLSLVSVLYRLTPALWPVRSDMAGGHVFNIVPSRIKLPEDSAKPPGIGKDGSGLAATLYAIKRNKEVHENDFWSYYVARPAGPSKLQVLEQLESYLRVVNPDIKQISVTNDSFDNQLRVAFAICADKYEALLPLALMSDGTLKWVALVTAALTANSVLSIEEPENYLHPQMQTRLIEILRDILFHDEPKTRATLLTTHSETLLNQCQPEELVITEMVGGKTVATRCSEPEEISAEIRRTGFGLGYYYNAGALND
jgi:predicted ATPase